MPVVLSGLSIHNSNNWFINLRGLHCIQKRWAPYLTRLRKVFLWVVWRMHIRLLQQTRIFQYRRNAALLFEQRRKMLRMPWFQIELLRILLLRSYVLGLKANCWVWWGLCWMPRVSGVRWEVMLLSCYLGYKWRLHYRWWLNNRWKYCYASW